MISAETAHCTLQYLTRLQQSHVNSKAHVPILYLNWTIGHGNFRRDRYALEPKGETLCSSGYSFWEQQRLIMRVTVVFIAQSY